MFFVVQGVLGADGKAIGITVEDFGRHDAHALIARRRLHASQQRANQQSDLPRPVTIAQPIPQAYSFPERTGATRIESERRRMRPALQKDSIVNVLPQPIKIDQPNVPTAPVAFPRGVFERRWLRRASHQPSLVIDPSPERTKQQADVEYPDRIVRPTFRAEQQLAITQLAPQPERKQQLADVEWPDRVLRPTMRAEQQRDLAFVPLLVTVTITPVEAPAWLARMRQAVVGAQLVDPNPEAPVAQTPVDAPVQVRRPSMAVALHLASTSLPPAPERTAPIAVVVSPDVIQRARMPAAHQLAATSIPPQPERSATDFESGYPDAVRRPALRIDHAYTTVIDPKPEQPVASSIASYPASTRRAARMLQHATVEPTPERESTIVDARAPDRIERAPSAVRHTVAAQPPALERAVDASDSSYPDVVSRYSLRVEHQQAVSAIPPQPEQTAPLADVRYADRVERVSRAPGSTVLDPKPEQPVTIPQVSYPDRLALLAPRRAEPVLGDPEDLLQPIDWVPIPPVQHRHPVQRVYFVPVLGPQQPRVVSIQPEVRRLTRTQGWIAHAPRVDQRVLLEWLPTYQDRPASALLRAVALKRGADVWTTTGFLAPRGGPPNLSTSASLLLGLATFVGAVVAGSADAVPVVRLVVTAVSLERG